MATQPHDDNHIDSDEEFQHTIRGLFTVDVRTTGFQLTDEDMALLSEWLESKFTLPRASWVDNHDRKYSKECIQRLTEKGKEGKLFIEEWELIDTEMDTDDYEPEEKAYPWTTEGIL